MDASKYTVERLTKALMLNTMAIEAIKHEYKIPIAVISHLAMNYIKSQADFEDTKRRVDNSLNSVDPVFEFPPLNAVKWEGVF